MKSFFFSLVIVSLLFSLDGFDVSSVLTFLLLPFINFKKLFSETSLMIKLFYTYNLFVIISIITNASEIELYKTVRPLAVVILSYFILTNRSFIVSFGNIFFSRAVKSIVLLDIIAFLLFFYFGISQLEGFKSFYPSLRYQGFYNLTVSALFKSFIVVLLIEFKDKINTFLFWISILVLITAILLSLTRTSWMVLVIYFISKFVLKVIKIHNIDLKSAARNILIISFFIPFIFFVVKDFFLDFEIAGISLEELFYNRLFTDTVNTESTAEIERGGFYYPIKIFNTLDISIFGNGFGTTDVAGGKLFGAEENLGAHNTFIHILFDYGLLSFVAFICFFCLLFINLIRDFINSINNVLSLQLLLCFLFSLMYQDLDYYLPMILVLCTILILSTHNGYYLLISQKNNTLS